MQCENQSEDASSEAWGQRYQDPTKGDMSYFHKDSLKNAAENWYSDPIYGNVYKQSMMEVLAGDGSESTFPVVTVMQIVKEA